MSCFTYNEINKKHPYMNIEKNEPGEKNTR